MPLSQKRKNKIMRLKNLLKLRPKQLADLLEDTLINNDAYETQPIKQTKMA